MHFNTSNEGSKCVRRSDKGHIWQALVRAVARAQHAVQLAAPLLTIPDNVPMDFRKFQEAQRHIAVGRCRLTPG